MLICCLAASIAATVRPTISLNTGATMPAIGFGTYQLNGSELKEALLEAIASGSRLIDTAAGYENEHIVAEAIAESGIPREDFFLTTKLWCTDHGGEETFDAIMSSLAQLNTEYADLYLIHAPANLGETDEETVELRLQSWRVMEELHAAGCLRAIGVSNFEPRHIEQLRLSEGSVTPAVNQIELHSYLGQREIREYCDSRGIVVQGYGAVGAASLLEDATVQQIATVHGRSASQVTLRHTLQRGCSALARSVTPSRIRENLDVLDFELTFDEVNRLDELDRGQRSYWDNSNVP